MRPALLKPSNRKKSRFTDRPTLPELDQTPPMMKGSPTVTGQRPRKDTKSNKLAAIVVPLYLVAAARSISTGPTRARCYGEGFAFFVWCRA
jgi:hypothetical protein